MKDGTDDIMTGVLQRPLEHSDRPLVMLLHGLGGSAQSAYMRVSAAALLAHGYSVLRLDWRGAGQSAGRTRAFYHAGRHEDLRTVISSMSGDLAGNGLVVVGYSLGGGILLNYLAEHGRGCHLRAAICVSAPLDLAQTQRRLSRFRNRLYHAHLLRCMKFERGAPDSIKTIREFDDKIVAPAGGFADALDYYQRCSAAPRLGAIQTPTLMIHARDDPWIDAAQYRSISWSRLTNLFLTMPWSGGHVGFHGLGLPHPWHDEVTLRFLAGYGSRSNRAASRAK